MSQPKRRDPEEGDATLPIPDQPSIIRQLDDILDFGPNITLPAAEGDVTPTGGSPQPSTASLPGRSGRYRFLREIAHGGIGAVYRTHDADLGRDVALKVLLDQHRGRPEATRRFVEEAQISGQLQHPGIVPLHEMGILAGDVPYFTMKLVKGRTLATLLADRKDPGKESQRFFGIFEQIAQTLAYAHARGVIHRDLKPSNIMIGAFGEVHVIDWGLAKVLAEGGIADERKAQKTHTQVSVIETIRSQTGSSQSLAGTVMGTPAYMPPEQAHGDVDDLDQRSDVFGLGAILCEILTGKAPYTGVTDEDVYDKARQATLDDAVSRLEGCGADREIVGLAKRCLAVEPRERPRDAGIVSRQVSDYLASADERARTAQVEAARARVREAQERKRRLLTTALAATVLGALVVGASAYVWTENQRMRRLETSIAAAARAIQETVDLRAQAMGAVSDLEKWELATAAAARSVERSEEVVGQDPTDLDVLRLRSRSVELRAELEQALASARRAAAVETENRRVVGVLDELRMEHAHGSAAGDIAERYRLAFAGHRADRASFPSDEPTFDVEELEPDVAAERIRASGIAEPMARALDHWAEALRRSGEEPQAWQKLIEIAVEADPAPRRQSIRRAVARTDSVERLEALRSHANEIHRRVAAESGGERFSALTIELLATSLLDAGDPKKAESMYNTAHRLHPRDFWAHHALAAILDGRGQGEESLRHFFAMVTSRNESPHAWKDLAAALDRKHQDLDAAVGALRQALRRRPEDADAQAMLGEVLARTENLDAAIAAFQEAARLKQKDAAIRFRLGRTLESRGDTAAAVDALREAVELSPTHSQARLRLGDLLIASGELEAAVGAFTAVIALEPNLARAHHGLGRALDRKGLLDGAIAAQRKAVELDPELARAHVELGIALDKKGDGDGALAALEEAVRRLRIPALVPSSFGDSVEPRPVISDAEWEKSRAILYEAQVEDPRLRLVLGRVLLRLRRYADAVSTLKSATEGDPGSVVARNALGLALARLDRHEEAVAQFDKALELDGKSVEARNGRGLTLFMQGKLDGALKEFQAALELDDSYDAARYNAAQCFAKQRNTQAVVRELERHRKDLRALHDLALASFSARLCPWKALGVTRAALELEPRNPTLLRVAARILERLGRVGEAIPTLRRSAALDPQSAKSWTLLGQVLLLRGDAALGDLEAAEAAFRKAIRLDSGIGTANLGLFDALCRQERFREAGEVFPPDWRELPQVRTLLESLSGEARERDVSSRALARLLEVPMHLDPPKAGAVETPVVVFRASQHVSSAFGASHLASHWQVRAEGDDYARNPTLDVASREHLTTLSLGKGHLLPRTTYYWRVAYIGSNGQNAGFSDETSFTTGDFNVRPVPFDISKHFNRDGVLNPGDPDDDTLQSESKVLLSVDGFDGSAPGSPEAPGLPVDRTVGVHRLGDYSRPNVLQLLRDDTEAVRIAVPRGRYSCVRYLVVGLGGNCRVPVTAEYADGSRETHSLHCEDTMTGPLEHPRRAYRGSEKHEMWTPVRKGMRRYVAGRLESTDSAIFEVVIPLREESEVVAFEIDPTSGEFARAGTTFNLLAITGMEVEGD